MVVKLNKTRKALVPKTLVVGTEVYLLDPIKTNKWQPKYLGPYTIVRRAHNGGYVLKDSTGDLLDRHVPIDQLKVLSSKESKPLINVPAAASLPVAEEQELKAEEAPVSYAVEQIISHTGDNPTNYKFLVKWVGYPHSENTWEPMANFEDREIITKYFKRLKRESPKQASTSASKKPRRN